MKQIVAQNLLEIKAVTLNPKEPYTWASGMRSPIYCDNRISLGYPDVRKNIVQGMVDLINEHYPEADVIMGVATAGIPWAAFISEVLDKPMAYVRSTAKDHGKTQYIEGKVTKDQTIVLIEDLISTGGSVLKCATKLKEDGYNVLGVVANFTYQLEKATHNFKQQNLNYHTVTNFETLIEVAGENNYIENKDKLSLKNWYTDPQKYQEQFK